MTHPLVKLGKKYYYDTHNNKPNFFNEELGSDKTTEFQKNANALVQNMKEYPHAFVLGCLMDSKVDAHVAWSIPYRVYEKLGTFEINDLYKITLEEYKNMFNGEKKWHRYPSVKAKVFYEAVHKIVENKFMNGDVSKIWTGKPSSQQVVTRFMDFKGCGLKIATMAANILCRDFGIEFSDYNYIDISTDIHTKRVFQRLGLTPYVKNSSAVEIYTICKARELNPEFPGIVDLLCWDIGRNYCRPNNPKCEKCPLNKFCDKKIETNEGIWNL